MAQVTDIPISELAAALNGRIKDLISRLGLKGQQQGNDFSALNPKRSDKSLGSFKICTSGAKQGTWADFADADARGDALDLVAYLEYDGDKKRAIEWAKRYLGLASGRPEDLARTRAAAAAQKEGAAQAQTDDAERKAKYAKAIYLNAEEDIRGTPVEVYLNGRAIDLNAFDRKIGGLRYAPSLADGSQNNPATKNWPCMVAPMTSLKGGFLGVHRTYLQLHANGAVTKAPIDPAKKVLGSIRGASIPLWHGASGKRLPHAPQGDEICLCEGIEDALTLGMAMPQWRIHATYSVDNMYNVVLPPTITKVWLALDNDGDNKATFKAVNRAKMAFTSQDREVMTFHPSEELNGVKIKDFNQYLMVDQGFVSE